LKTLIDSIREFFLPQKAGPYWLNHGLS
jgi:hypothetical protein